MEENQEVSSDRYYSKVLERFQASLKAHLQKLRHIQDHGADDKATLRQLSIIAHALLHDHLDSGSIVEDRRRSLNSEEVKAYEALVKDYEHARIAALELFKKKAMRILGIE